MAQAMASMTGLLDGTSSSRLLSGKRVSTGRAGFIVRAQQTPVESEAVAQTGRRAALGLIAAGLTGGVFAKAVLAEARSIKVGPPPPPSGGLSKHSLHFYMLHCAFSSTKLFSCEKNTIYCLNSII
jgi:photosystem II oxygen-evolving enhancer protein 3